jgi:hypothetical protein
MKHFIPLTAIAAIVASGTVSAQTPAYSKPSGYVTQTLVEGFNPIGFTLQLPATTSGSLTTVGTTSVSDSTKNFATLLTAGSLYTLEITSGVATVNGLVTEVAQWTGSQLTTADNLTAAGVAQGSSYVLRKAATLEEIFGTTASVLAKSNAIGNADVVWVPNGLGGYARYHQRADGSWRNADTGVFPVNTTPLVYLDGVFVQKRTATQVNLVLTGSVKTTPTVSSLSSGFNFYATIYPVGSTLQNLGLDNDLAKSNAIGSADVVWVPNGTAGYTRYHMRADGVWRNAETGVFPAPTVEITSAVFIQRRGAPTALGLTPPPSYSGL